MKNEINTLAVPCVWPYDTRGPYDGAVNFHRSSQRERKVDLRSDNAVPSESVIFV